MTLREFVHGPNFTLQFSSSSEATMCCETLPQAGLIQSSARAVRGAYDGVVGSIKEFNKCAALVAEAPRGAKLADEGRQGAKRGSFTLEEVSRHCSESDAWLVVRNRVRIAACTPAGHNAVSYAEQLLHPGVRCDCVLARAPRRPRDLDICGSRRDGRVCHIPCCDVLGTAARAPDWRACSGGAIWL